MKKPLVTELEYRSPEMVFSLFSHMSGAVFLDTASGEGYSYIAIDPFLILNNESVDTLDHQLGQFFLESHINLPMFQGGAVGYLGYEAGCYDENISVNDNDVAFSNMVFGLYDLVFAFDLVAKKTWLFSSGFPELDNTKRQERASQRMLWVKSLYQQENKSVNHAINAEPITSNFTKENYMQSVSRIIDYIYAGDIYQANMSQRFSSRLANMEQTYALYCKLREGNPAPFCCYLNFNDTVIASSSPERFIKLQNNKVSTSPIKGTMPRSKEPKKDAENASILLASEKDKSENIMIVDLLRNDISKVCKPNTVNVTELCELHSFATVHHLISTVEGELETDKTAVDLINACFPGGSITGAPKVRAMEIIAEQETKARGPYCGCIGYIGFDGNMDTSITIRTYAIKDNVVTFHAGGAIVADSDPESEYNETLDKARALINALGQDHVVSH